MDFRCIHCGFRIVTLIVQYSPENIRLVKCQNCRAVADEYIECELMILLIDLILHDPKAYRHLLYNAFSRPIADSKGLLWWSTFGYLILDACILLIKFPLFFFPFQFKQMLSIHILSGNMQSSLATLDRILFLKNSENEWGSTPNFSSVLWRYLKVWLNVCLENFIFLSIFLRGTRIVLNKPNGAFRDKDLLLTVLISSYLKIFLIATMVWEFPSSVALIIDIFVLSSNTVALKVTSESSAKKCMAICFIAHAAKFLTGQVFDMLCLHP